MKARGMYAISDSKLARFDRNFFDAKETFTCIGSGALGGKASGLAFIRDILSTRFNPSDFPGVTVNVPTLTVIRTDFFDSFMESNKLYEVVGGDLRDDQIAVMFQKAQLPGELVGDLRALIALVHTPLAVRSSSLLEDALYEPFAGVYETKMIPNNQLDTDTRFRKLAEAVKFVYASTFFRKARNYLKLTGRTWNDEKMAVIIQEVVGARYGDRYYPHVSGVARSYNYYPVGHAKPEDGIVSLALGLGKTIVDGGQSWNFSPAYPRANPPYNSIKDLCQHTQSEFWAVNMGKPPAYDPIHETEYLQQGNLREAEVDKTLRFIASTYQVQNDRVVIGAGSPGTRIVTFAPLLVSNSVPLTGLLRKLLELSHESLGNAVEIEFAITLDSRFGLPARFGYLQVRPMVVTQADVEISDKELSGNDVLLSSDQVLGNGIIENIRDIVYVNPESFAAAETVEIASELDSINQKMTETGRPYLLIGFGRWGSTDPWLGIPVDWSQISGARVIVEATLPEFDIEPSQGSHFFHNLTSFQICYFTIHYHSERNKIDWQWLRGQKPAAEYKYVKHLQLDSFLHVKVDGRSGRGVIRI